MKFALFVAPDGEVFFAFEPKKALLNAQVRDGAEVLLLECEEKNVVHPMRAFLGLLGKVKPHWVKMPLKEMPQPNPLRCDRCRKITIAEQLGKKQRALKKFKKLNGHLPEGIAR